MMFIMVHVIHVESNNQKISGINSGINDHGAHV